MYWAGIKHFKFLLGKANALDMNERYFQTSLTAKNDPALKERLILRSNALSAFRTSFLKRGYVEVDTPILRQWEDPTDNPVFATLGPNNWPRLHLRTCPEEYTRRAAAAFGKAFEMGKSFRNSSIDLTDHPKRHLPEFSLLEFYEVGNTLDQAMTLFTSVFQEVASTLGHTKVNFNSQEIDFRDTVERKTVFQALTETHNKECLQFVNDHQNDCPPGTRDTEASRLAYLIDTYVRPNLSGMAFISGFPYSADPYPDVVIDKVIQRAEFSVAGMEVGEVTVLQTDTSTLEKHISEAIVSRHGNHLDSLVDPWYLKEIDQLDQPLVGGGIGFDRFLMTLTGVDDIREVVWYAGIAERHVRPRRL